MFDIPIMLGLLLVDNGLPIAEVSLRTPCALEVIAEMSKIEGLTVGSGTVLPAKNAEDAVKARASFLVSPALHEETIIVLSR